MKVEDLDASIQEAQRFIKRAKDAKKRMNSSDFHEFVGSKETGAVKRAALDLKMELTNITKQS